jgi:hypothetical protein
MREKNASRHQFSIVLQNNKKNKNYRMFPKYRDKFSEVSTPLAAQVHLRFSFKEFHARSRVYLYLRVGSHVRRNVNFKPKFKRYEKDYFFHSFIFD